MASYLGNPDFEHGTPEPTGVLVTNLGTPDAPSPAALRRYLAEFLSDPRVVELPRWLWWPLLHGVILPLRPRRSAAAYRTIWTAEGSPLRVIAARQAEALQQRLEARFAGPVRVALGMRYGNPSLARALEDLHGAGVARLLVLPLYPQYSATTTGATFDALSAVLRTWRRVPELRMITAYHDHPAYVAALAASIEEAWRTHGRPERLLFSFHGIPLRYFQAGDPYYCHCHKTARLVTAQLGLEPQAWSVAFQSRVGRAPWLEPYTDRVLERWGAEGLARVDVVCPGFSADCLETLEEIAIRGREQFVAAGGGELRYVGALNDRPDHIEALAGLVLERTRDWQHADAAGADLPARQARARDLGAPR